MVKENTAVQVLRGLQLVEVCCLTVTPTTAGEARACGRRREHLAGELERLVAVVRVDRESDVDRFGLKILADDRARLRVPGEERVEQRVGVPAVAGVIEGDGRDVFHG